MKYNIKTITDKDIEVVMNYNAEFGEITKAIDLIKCLKPKYGCNDELWEKMSLVLYAYKLGEMQGKRAERAKKAATSKTDSIMNKSVSTKINNLRIFRYRKKQYIVSEIDLPVEHFEGACSYQHGILCCVLNINLSDREKQNTLHRLIVGKKRFVKVGGAN